MNTVLLPYSMIQKKSKEVNINPNEAFHIIAKHYCQKMISAGLCPRECSQCTLAINEMFELDSASKKEALMVYKARNEYAKAVETDAERYKAKPKEKSFMDFFEKKHENGIVNLLNMIEGL